MKKHLLFGALLLCNVAAAQTFSGGTGTKNDPYLISNVNDLEELGNMTDKPGANGEQQTYGKYFRLTQDIAGPFTGMIGYEGLFKGDFDGGGHCITLDINMPNENYVGLFGTVKSGAVHDLAVSGSVVGCNYVGGIVANPTNEAVLYNLCNYADVTSTSTAVLSCVGGVIGGIISKAEGSMEGATVSNCANFGHVESDGCALGGVIGYSGQQTGNTICDVANYGYVESSNTMRIAGTIGNPMWNDKVHRIANFGMLSNENFSGCIGNANPTDIGEVVYDKQTACSSISIPAQERNTADLLGERQKETLGSNWVYAEDMLPRPKMNGLESSDMAVLYATPVILADGDNLNSVTKDFRVSLGNDQNTKVAWKASRGLVEILTDGTARIKGGGTEILTASYKNVSRDIQIVIKGTDSIDDINVGSKEGDNLWRNLNGQVVATPTHGIYIRNGKKIIVR